MSEILFVTGKLPFPLDDGWKIRTYHLIKGMADSGYVVDLVSFVRPDEDPQSLETMRKLCRSVYVEVREKHYSALDLLKGLFSKVPFTVYNYHTTGMAKIVSDVSNNNMYDFIQFEDIVMSQYMESFTGKCLNVMIDMHNIESSLMERYASEEKNPFKKIYAYLTASKLKEYEIDCGGICSKVLVCSQEDADILGKRGLSGKVEVIPNGVDTDYFHPMHAENEKNIVFVGSMDYHANISGVLHFAEKIFPKILEKNPDIKWYIVGKNPTQEVMSLVSSNIIITGSVSDVRPYVAGASVVVAPLLVGGGTRLKILEAMSMGKPIVATSIGAEGIELTSGENIILADSDDEFAESVLELLIDGQRAEQLGKNAYKRALDTYAWNHICRLLAKVYEPSHHPVCS